ncbi:beta-lactamase [Phenylobacterium zucineum HLK1]|uniref:Beta-lactamase n=2 Tax=Phenylobacterium zucineum TaxID=284016 RepID=B4RCT4_PHEZH|nr:beta-lactamase [Phenylobacterium zucineum HLK1]
MPAGPPRLRCRSNDEYGGKDPMHVNRNSAAARMVGAMTAVALVLAPAHGTWAAPKKAPAALELSQAVAPEAVGFDSARLARLDAYMAKVVESGRVAGMTTFLARHGKVVSFKTYGKKSLATGEPMTPDTIFRIYSMTKPVTGVAMMILFEEGRWRLDDPVTRYVPEFKDLKVLKGVDGNGQPILEDLGRPPTMREVMAHTAGFGYGLAEEHPVDKLYREKQVLSASSTHEMIQRTAQIPLAFQPGTQWRYSSSVDIQGYIVEKLTGQRLGDFMAERIFRPLRMPDTAFHVPAEKAGRLAAVYVGNKETGRIEEAKALFGGDLPTYLEPPPWDSGGGGLVSTTMDYARFAQMIANKGELDGVRILSPASVEMMGTNMIPKEVLVSSNGTTGARFNEAVGFGLDFMVVNEPRAAGTLEGKGSMSWGGAAGTWFWVDPTNDVVFVGMIQRFGGSGGDDLGAMARTLTYQALVNPER